MIPPSTPAPTDAGALADERKHYLGAIRLRLAQFYDECPNDARLREHISDECDWLDAEIASNSAPKETRGDEPVGHMDVLQSIIRRALAWQPTERGPSHHEISAELNGMLRATLAASQQSPRLEREGIEAAVRETLKHLDRTAAAPLSNYTFDTWVKTIDALLSPDTAVVSSTSRRDDVRTPKVRTSHRRNKEEAARLQALVDERYAASSVPSKDRGAE